MGNDRDDDQGDDTGLDLVQPIPDEAFAASEGEGTLVTRERDTVGRKQLTRQEREQLQSAAGSWAAEVPALSEGEGIGLELVPSEQETGMIDKPELESPADSIQFVPDASHTPADAAALELVDTPARRGSVASRRTIEAAGRAMPSMQMPAQNMSIGPGEVKTLLVRYVNGTASAAERKVVEGNPTLMSRARQMAAKVEQAEMHSIERAALGGDWRLNTMGKLLLFVCAVLAGTFVGVIFHWPRQSDEPKVEAIEVAPALVPERIMVAPTYNGPEVVVTVPAGETLVLSKTSTPSIDRVRKARGVTVVSEAVPQLVAPLGPAPCSTAQREKKKETTGDCCSRVVEGLNLKDPFPVVEKCERSPETWRPNGRK